jgi:hypothetical protein
MPRRAFLLHVITNFFGQLLGFAISQPRKNTLPYIYVDVGSHFCHHQILVALSGRLYDFPK